MAPSDVDALRRWVRQAVCRRGLARVYAAPARRGVRFLALVVCVAFFGLTATQARAARAPTAQEKSAIIAAIKQRSAPAVRPRYEVRDILVSTLGPYARGLVVGVGIYRRTIQQGWALLHGSGRDWHVLDVTGSLECAEAPPEVFKDLKLSCVGPPSPPSPPPPDAKCDDLATIAPSLGERAERTLWHLPSFASRSLPLAVKVSAALGGIGVCQTGLSLLTAGLGSPVLPQVSLKAQYSGSHPVFKFGFDPLGWEIPSGTGAPADQSLIPTFDWSNAIEFSAGPQLDLSYVAGDPLDAELSFLRVDAFPLKAVLVLHGTAFLDATVGPQLSFDVGIDKKALAKKIAERVAGGEDPETATDEIAQETDQELKVGIERSVAQAAPLDTGAATFTTDVTAATDDLLVVMETDLPAEASVFIGVVDGSTVGIGAADLAAPAAEEVAGGSLLDLLGLFLLAPDHRFATIQQRAPSAAITPSATGAIPRSNLLAASPVGRLSRRALKRAPFARQRVAALIPETFTLTTRTHVGPLAVTQTHLHAGQRLSILAPGLRRGSHHAAELVLAGPGYRASRLLAVSRNGVAGATFKMPRSLRPGSWIIAVRDISGIHADSARHLTGSAVIRAGVFTITPQRHASHHGRQTYVSINAGGVILRVEPVGIHVVSNENLINLRWSTWGGPRAEGTGTDSSSFPTAGHAQTNPVRVQLTNRRQCGSKLVYTALRIRFTRGTPYAHEPSLISFSYGCPR